MKKTYERICKIISKRKVTIAIIILILILTIILLGLVLYKNNLNKTMLANKQEEKYMETIYFVRETKENKMNVTIYFKSNVPITKITKPDGKVLNITVAGKKQIAIDYIVESGKQYKFKIEQEDSLEEQEYVLNANIDARPKISQNKSLEYALITQEGVILGKDVNIDFGENEENYISWDEGETWEKYEGKIDVKRQGKIWAKTVKQGEITKVEEGKITLELADDAIGPESYDGDINTYYKSDDVCYIEVDQAMVGKKVRILENNETFRIAFYDKSKKEISNYSKFRTKDVTLEIPKDTKYIGCNFHSNNICEIEPILNPTFKLVENPFPKITSQGPIQVYNKVTINYMDSQINKLYSLDNENWEEYVGQEIKLEIGQKLYAKAINKNGVETDISEYISSLPEDAIGKESYDGNYNTSCMATSKQYMEIDEDMVGKTIRVKPKGASCNLYLCDKDKKTIGTYIYLKKGEYEIFDVPEGAKYLRFNSNEICEIEVEKKIEIYTIEDLENIANGLNNSYILMNNLDFKDRNSYRTEEKYKQYYNEQTDKVKKSWKPIGTGFTSGSGAFTGILDGNYYKISNLYINDTSGGEKSVGLFYCIYGKSAKIENLLLENIDIISKVKYTGGLAGIVREKVIISNVGVSGNINGYNLIGGLIGNVDDSEINKCYSNVSIIGHNLVGGLISEGGSSSSTIPKITNSYATGNVYVTSTTYSAVAGFITGGNNAGSYFAIVTNCYSIGNVKTDGKSTTYIGGFFGKKATGTNVTNSYWNIETSGWETSPGGGIGKTTEQMKQQSTYVGWDFTNTWYMDEETGYPKLQWEKLIK